jgi:hypothetical protein
VSPAPGPPSLDDQLTGVIRLLRGLFVHAIGFLEDGDGNPGVTIVRPRPYDVRSHSAPLSVMLDPDKAIEWAICVAAVGRGVRA